MLVDAQEGFGWFWGAALWLIDFHDYEDLLENDRDFLEKGKSHL
jgi:hypothetical protein